MSTKKQRQDIGYMRRLLNINEETYRDILNSFNGATSSKDLTITEAYELLKSMRDKAKDLGLFKPKKTFQKYKYNNMDERSGMASPKQLRMIEAMWKDVSILQNETDRQVALKNIIKRITGKDDIKFITAVDVRKLVKAFENISKN